MSCIKDALAQHESVVVVLLVGDDDETTRCESSLRYGREAVGGDDEW
jgi:hypothetical protein